MYKFTDYYRNKVHLSFDKEPFSKNPKHVWVICRHRNRWLLTKHPTRGIEFPGGKVEDGETAETAAIREVLEETGGVVKTLEYIAQYNVTGKNDTVIKNVYFAHIGQLTDIYKEYETLGPLFMKNLPKNLSKQKNYSFMMKDEVLMHCLHHIKQTKKLPET